ncbi:MAG: sigma-70 family RNA polymerase sigma factor [Deltaproteobacteria bacterium]|nr:sigma-70 family RNA polymerase sigma factor [Deltaproteobacteria bacterium]
MANTDITEDELLKGCISKDKGKWDLFVKKYNKLIYHTIYKTLRVNDKPTGPDDVNDLFQEVFASLYADNFKKLRVFDPVKGCSSLASWLRMITVRMTIDHLRKNKPTTSIDDLPTEPSQAGHQEAIINEESLNQLKDLLKELQAKDKLLVELFFMRELPPEEVAQILHISVGAFYTRKNRVIERLKNIANDRNIL